jgi:hypothetical protein
LELLGGGDEMVGDFGGDFSGDGSDFHQAIRVDMQPSQDEVHAGEFAPFHAGRAASCGPKQ